MRKKKVGGAAGRREKQRKQRGKRTTSPRDVISLRQTDLTHKALGIAEFFSFNATKEFWCQRDQEGLKPTQNCILQELLLLRFYSSHFSANLIASGMSSVRTLLTIHTGCYQESHSSLL